MKTPAAARSPLDETPTKYTKRNKIPVAAVINVGVKLLESFATNLAHFPAILFMIENVSVSKFTAC